MIKSCRPCMFSDKCMDCLCRDYCISVSRLKRDKRQFIISQCHSPIYTLEQKAIFQKGTDKHEEMQKDLKELDDMGYIEFRRLLHKNEVITFKELKVCSCKGYHGIIDKISIQFVDGVFNVYIDEFKSNWAASNIVQLIFYSLILSDPNSKVVYKEKFKRKKGFKRLLGHFYPSKVITTNIYGRIFYMYQEEQKDYIPLVINNQFTEFAAGIKNGILKKNKIYKDIVLNKVCNLEHVPYCKHCNQERCGWAEICGKYSYLPKEHQLYHGRKKMLVLNRPIII